MQDNLFQIDNKLLEMSERAESELRGVFKRVDDVASFNENKVLKAFVENKVSESHFTESTGYGYGDRGREVLDSVYAQVFGAEDALVRHNFVSGTHALTVALFGILRPGDVMLSVAGTPYDTIHEVIGIRGKGNGSLKDFGVKYREMALLEDGTVDIEGIPKAVHDVKLVYIQRSRGYSLRSSIDVATIEKIIKAVRKINPGAIIMVDNCYGEFAEKLEPTQVGADIIVGSLIKNPGGGIAKTGGYIAGKAKLVELCSYRLTTPGTGKEVGCTLGQTRGMFMGLFFAPSVVANAIKTSCFALKLFSGLGYEVYPNWNENRTDIIAAIRLGDSERLIAFCQGIQRGSPADSFVSPEPWDMPGYDSKVIMSAGAFTLGASIELSADAPLKEPYAVWLQGGLTYNTGKIGVLHAAQAMLDKSILFLK